MKFYVRESQQEQYHYQPYDQPRGLSLYQIKPNDTWCSHWADYHIDKVTYSKDELIVYATKTPLLKVRKNTYYKNRRNKGENN